MKVAMFRKTDKGYYRAKALDLFRFLQNHTEDEKIKAYRKTKTKKNPKGDQELKRSIKAFMPSGDYGAGVARSKNSKLEIETGLVQLDFDITITRAEVEKIFNSYKIIAVAGVSCGGNGFYLLIQTPGAEGYEEYWQALCAYFKSETGYNADPSVSSVNEIRYVSLTTDVLIREKPTVWKKKSKKDVSRFDAVRIPRNGTLIEPDTFNLHYVDLVSIIGLNNSNGTPLEAVQNYFKSSMFAPDSHLRKAKPAEISAICERIYTRYAEQHGEAIIPLLLTDHKVSLPKLDIPKDATQRYIALLVVKNMFESYMIKTDAKTRVTYKFTGAFWEEISDHDLRNFLSSCADASNAPRDIIELKDFRDLMLNQLKDTTSITFTTPADMFNLSNGVLKFSGGNVTFVEHSAEYLFTYILDYEYLPDAPASDLLEAFLERTIPDEASLVSLFQYIGSAFSDIRVELFLIILGGGANGKSTLVNLLTSCLGGAVGRYNLDTLTDVNPEIAAKEARNIYNRVLAVDTESSRIKDPRLWRKLISKEPVSVKFLYKDIFETTNYARLISCMNETPFIDTLEGSARRVLAIQTGRSLKREEYDLEIDKKLNRERPAMLNRIITGYKEFHKQRGVLSVSDESKTQTIEILDEFNLVIQFMKHKRYFLIAPVADTSNKTTKPEKYLSTNAKHLKRLEKDGAVGGIKHLTLAELYTQFVDFCEDEGIHKTKIYTKRLFVRRLKTVSRVPYSSEEGVIHNYLDWETGTERYPLGQITKFND
jgi:phage/plasmid-associated DNA primase